MRPLSPGGRSPYAPNARPARPPVSSHSQETLRVHVDRDPDVAPDLRAPGEPVPQVRLEVDVALGLDEEPEAVAAADQGEGRLGGAEHHCAGRRSGDLSHDPRVRLRGLALVRRYDEGREPAERW